MSSVFSYSHLYILSMIKNVDKHKGQKYRTSIPLPILALSSTTWVCSWKLGYYLNAHTFPILTAMTPGMVSENNSSVKEFILLGLTQLPELQLFHTKYSKQERLRDTVLLINLLLPPGREKLPLGINRQQVVLTLGSLQYITTFSSNPLGCYRGHKV